MVSYTAEEERAKVGGWAAAGQQGGRGKKGKKRIMPETVDPFWVIHHSPGRADADHGACVGGWAADQGSPIRTKAYTCIKIFFLPCVGSGNKYMV